MLFRTFLSFLNAGSFIYSLYYTGATGRYVASKKLGWHLQCILVHFISNASKLQIIAEVYMLILIRVHHEYLGMPTSTWWLEIFWDSGIVCTGLISQRPQVADLPRMPRGPCLPFHLTAAHTPSSCCLAPCIVCPHAQPLFCCCIPTPSFFLAFDVTNCVVHPAGPALLLACHATPLSHSFAICGTTAPTSTHTACVFLVESAPH